jgi:hypothetical protein
MGDVHRHLLRRHVRATIAFMAVPPILGDASLAKFPSDGRREKR